MSSYSVKEASSFDTQESLSRVFDSFDKDDLGHSQSGIEEFKLGCSSDESKGTIKVQTFQKIMKWFENKGIKYGCPENIIHSFSCKQKDSLKNEENSMNISLTGSSIILRRNKRSLKQDTLLINL